MVSSWSHHGKGADSDADAGAVRREGGSPGVGVTRRQQRAAVAAALAVIAAVGGLTASALSRVAFTMYDEGVYYFQAVRLATGEVPYRDFFVPQPPGVLLIGAASERVGAGVTGVRAVNWLCGFVLLFQTYRLTRRLAGGNGTATPAGAVAAALVAVGVVFAYQSIQGATNMPAACLELAACLLVLGERRGRFALEPWRNRPAR